MDLTELKPNLLVQSADREVLKISNVYPTRVTAQVVYPLKARTTVREYTPEQVAFWIEPTAALIAKYETAWGYR